jgi:hypothetical protein
MRIITNTEHIEKRARLARIISYAGLAILGGGFVTSLLRPELILLAYVTLPIGIVLANIGIYLANRYLRQPRPDQVLDQALKGLNDQYIVYHYMLPASHVLVTPQGVHPVIVKFQPGTFINEGERWQQRQGCLARFMRLFGQEGIGNPTREARTETQALTRHLSERAPSLDVPIEPLIVFTHPEADVTITDPAVEVVLAKKLKTHLRAGERGRGLPRSTLTQLEEALPTLGARVPRSPPQGGEGGAPRKPAE